MPRPPLLRQGHLRRRPLVRRRPAPRLVRVRPGPTRRRLLAPLPHDRSRRRLLRQRHVPTRRRRRLRLLRLLRHPHRRRLQLVLFVVVKKKILLLLGTLTGDDGQPRRRRRRPPRPRRRRCLPRGAPQARNLALRATRPRGRRRLLDHHHRRRGQLRSAKRRPGRRGTHPEIRRDARRLGRRLPLPPRARRPLMPACLPAARE
mmetsp:Transcript_18895/g.59366  ORF Transcript_18895/g.59366 Transcript_18895/m.59366 type:complete len:203 (-) Transcript_18895:359-967(-)